MTAAAFRLVSWPCPFRPYSFDLVEAPDRYFHYHSCLLIWHHIPAKLHSRFFNKQIPWKTVPALSRLCALGHRSCFTLLGYLLPSQSLSLYSSETTHAVLSQHAPRLFNQLYSLQYMQYQKGYVHKSSSLHDRLKSPQMCRRIQCLFFALVILLFFSVPKRFI